MSALSTQLTYASETPYSDRGRVFFSDFLYCSPRYQADRARAEQHIFRHHASRSVSFTQASISISYSKVREQSHGADNLKTAASQ